jgi:hypothetical protein
MTRTTCTLTLFRRNEFCDQLLLGHEMSVLGGLIDWHNVICVLAPH